MTKLKDKFLLKSRYDGRPDNISVPGTGILTTRNGAMTYTRLLGILFIVLLNMAGISALAQTKTGRIDNGNTTPGKGKIASPDKDKASLTAAEARLMAGSKRAILEAGISEPYFEKHFQLINVMNQPSDRRVVWKYTINEYEAILNDAVGYYTSDGERIDTHSIKDTLGSAYDIEKTITKKQAEKSMKDCIGKYASQSIMYRSLAVPGKATLYMTATSASKKRDNAERREREEERRKEAKKGESKKKDSQLDAIEEEEDENEGPPVYFGIVNLETGKCTKGKAVVTPYTSQWSIPKQESSDSSLNAR